MAIFALLLSHHLELTMTAIETGAIGINQIENYTICYSTLNLALICSQFCANFDIFGGSCTDPF